MCSVRTFSEIFGRINRKTPVPQYPFTAGCNLATPCKIDPGTCALLWILWHFLDQCFIKHLSLDLDLNNCIWITLKLLCKLYLNTVHFLLLFFQHVFNFFLIICRKFHEEILSQDKLVMLMLLKFSR